MWNIFWGLCLPPCLVRSTSEAWLLADELDCYRLENSSSLYWWYETFTCVLLFLFVSWFVLDFSVLCIFKGRSSPVVPTLCAPISCGLDIWGRLVVCGLFSKNVSFCGLFSEGVPVDPTLSDQSCGEPLLSLFYFLCSQCFVDRGPKRLLSTDVCLNLSFKPRIIFLKMLVLNRGQNRLCHIADSGPLIKSWPTSLTATTYLEQCLVGVEVLVGSGLFFCYLSNTEVTGKDQVLFNLRCACLVMLQLATSRVNVY